MIVVNSGIMQERLKKLVEGLDSPKFSFIKKDGIKLYFSCNCEDENSAVLVVKKAIKSDPITVGLLVSVKIEN